MIINLENVVYQPLRELEIAGIDASIVEPHNEVVPYWIIYDNAVVFHVDKHTDWGDHQPSFEHVNSLKPNLDFTSYCNNHLFIGDVICPSVHYGNILAVYHYDPRDDFIRVRGRVRNNLVLTPLNTKIDKGLIKWDPDEIEEISFDDFLTDMQGLTYPLIFDNDLDAYESVDDMIFSQDRDESLYAAELRLDNTFNLLRKIKRPDLVTIARSTTEKNPLNESSGLFTPSDRVDYYEREVINRITEIEKLRIAT